MSGIHSWKNYFIVSIQFKIFSLQHKVLEYSLVSNRNETLFLVGQYKEVHKSIAIIAGDVCTCCGDKIFILLL